MLKQCLLLSALGFVGLLAISAVAQNPGDPANIANNANVIHFHNQNHRPLCQECTNLHACTMPESSSAWYQNGHFDPPKRTEQLTKRLKLTADQQSQMLDSLESTKSQLEAVRSDQSLSRKVRDCKLALIRQASNDQISAFLEKKQNATLARIRSYKYNVDRSPVNWGP
jgi:predicted GIY-YIG superfamily endonuclease